MKTVLAILLFAGTAFSQAQMSSGNIKGTVTDASSAVVPGATVSITGLNTGVERRTITDALGNFRFFVLPPTSYELKVSFAGFATLTRRPIQVTVGETV